MRQRIGIAKRRERGHERANTGFKIVGRIAPQPASNRGLGDVRHTMLGDPACESDAVKWLVEPCCQTGQGDNRGLAAPHQVCEPFVEAAVCFYAEAIQRHQGIGVVGLTAILGVSATCSFSGGLEHCPPPRVGQQSPKEVFAAVLRRHVTPPPTEARRVTSFTSPGDGDLRRQDRIQ